MQKVEIQIRKFMERDVVHMNLVRDAVNKVDDETTNEQWKSNSTNNGALGDMLGEWWIHQDLWSVMNVFLFIMR